MAGIDMEEYRKVMPDIQRKDWGKEFIVLCPCGGAMHAKRILGKGRYKASCKSCGFHFEE